MTREMQITTLMISHYTPTESFKGSKLMTPSVDEDVEQPECSRLVRGSIRCSGGLLHTCLVTQELHS